MSARITITLKFQKERLKKFFTKVCRKKALKHERNRKTFAADSIRKKGIGFSIILKSGSYLPKQCVI